MESAASLGTAARSADPANGLRAAAALRRLGEELELAQVRKARALGWSWSQIGLFLNLTKQAVHHKYAPLMEESGDV